MQTKSNLRKEKKSIKSKTETQINFNTTKRNKNSLSLEDLLQANDSQLITLYKSGDDNAFAVLLNRHKNRIFTINKRNFLNHSFQIWTLLNHKV